MELSWPESVLSNRERVMEELIQGRELASQLCRVLDDHKSTLVSGCGGGDIGSAEGLVNKILGSFANTLLILNGNEADGEIVSGDQIQGNSSGGGSADSSSWDANHAIIKSEDFHEEISCKSPSTIKDRRGSYKRRRTSHSWTRDTQDLIDDGHAWRKYGQKVIHNAKHPRNYFRCTHKFDQSCQATKHVQKILDDPPVFRTTYYGNHTCRDYLKASELKEVIIKEEKLQPSDDHMMASHHHNHSSSCDYIVSPHPTAFKSSCPLSGLSSTIDPYDHEGDVMSGLIVEPYYFDDEVLQYEF
ncbi:putative WRKY transcription factor 70 [Prunus yedoensis var. nudiflora]|uniref:Putative WRKY transcription factor 70 n=1 Tax=Prunus yedoensis var. nudiflora TaxID=2094558 RepID=A0A314UK22_PRUYE|nr:putative WRKY transcription factor 70 [Prunus yedoensis var. nudiflora]